MDRDITRMVIVWASMMALLALTIGASFVPMGKVLPAVSYGIAATKAALVIWFFMEMRSEEGIVRVATVAGFAWLAILLILSTSDSATRGLIGFL